MSLRTNANTAFPSRAAIVNLAGATVMGWCYVVSDRAANTGQPVFNATETYGTDADVYFNWEASTEAMRIGSYNPTNGDSSAIFASRPSVGAWFHWYVQIASGASQLVAGWRADGAAAYTTAAGTLRALATGTVGMRLGNDGLGSWGDMRHAAFKLYDGVLPEEAILYESYVASPRRTTALLMACPMRNQGSWGDLRLDTSRRRNDWTINGTPTMEVDPLMIDWSVPRRRVQVDVPAAAAGGTATIRPWRMALMGVN